MYALVHGAAARRLRGWGATWVTDRLSQAAGTIVLKVSQAGWDTHHAASPRARRSHHAVYCITTCRKCVLVRLVVAVCARGRLVQCYKCGPPPAKPRLDTLTRRSSRHACVRMRTLATFLLYYCYGIVWWARAAAEVVCASTPGAASCGSRLTASGCVGNRAAARASPAGAARLSKA
jgi:hypothetical protein